MAIPDVADMRKPLLEILARESPCHIDDYTEQIGSAFAVTSEEMEQRRDSGHGLFRNLVQWARRDMTKAGLVQGAGRNLLSITDRGKEVLRRDLDLSDSAVLRQLQKERRRTNAAL